MNRNVFFKGLKSLVLVSISTTFIVITAVAAQDVLHTADPLVAVAPVEVVPPVEGKNLTTELEDLKAQVLKLNRELFILEEDLLFPASTQISVFVSVDIGRFFTLDSVELKIDDQDVAGFLYTDRQRTALEQGGIQKLYLGNIKMGEHELTAIFTGIDAEGRLTKKAVNYQFEKDDESIMIELKIEDDTAKYQAKVAVEEWIL